VCGRLPRQGTHHRAFFRSDVFVETFFVYEMTSVTIEGAVQIVPCTTFFSGVDRRFFSSFSTRVLNF